MGDTSSNSSQGNGTPIFTPPDLAALAIITQISELSDRYLCDEITILVGSAPKNPKKIVKKAMYRWYSAYTLTQAA